MKRRDFIRNALFAGFGVACGVPSALLPAHAEKEIDWNPTGFADAEIVKMSNDVIVTITGEDITLKPGESALFAYVNGYWVDVTEE